MDRYEDIYNRMKESYCQESGYSFDEASDIAIRLKVLAGEIYSAQTNIEWIKRQMFINTATGERLDYFASERGLKRRKATKAKGTINFFITDPAKRDILIPKGTVVATNDEEPIRFVTTIDSMIMIGSKEMVIPAEAQNPGINGNIAQHKIVIKVNVPLEIERVSNKSIFKNGSDEETDDELRKRIQESFIHLANGTNAAYYEQLALSVDGISKAKAVGKYRGNGTVDVFVFDKSSVSESAIAQAQSLISKMRELNVDVMVKGAQKYSYDLDIRVTKKAEFTSQQVTTMCTEAFKSFIESLGIGEKLYLSSLGKALLDTGCIDTYEFNTVMEDKTIPKSQCFAVGDISILVI